MKKKISTITTDAILMEFPVTSRKKRLLKKMPPLKPVYKTLIHSKKANASSASASIVNDPIRILLPILDDFLG